MKLKNNRILLDEIDKKISLLLNERFLIVEQIKKIKEELSLEVLDQNREKEVLENNIKYVDEKYSKSFLEIFNTILKVSKDIQENE